jgi:ATP-dependent Clp protease protease subunit
MKEKDLKDLKDFKLFARDHGVSSTTFDKYTGIINNNTFNPTSIAANLPGGMPAAMTPNIIEERQMNAVAMDVFSRLMMDRIIFLGTGIDDMVANVINAQLLFLESTNSKKDITIYVNSPGGSVYAGLGIYDVMQFVEPSIVTVNTGIAASMAYVLACAGEKGKRYSLPHARFMQHQPLGGASGQASDIEITAKEIQKLKKELYEIIANHTGQEYQKIWDDCDRDHWMTAAEAKDYGCIDGVLRKNKNKN